MSKFGLLNLAVKVLAKESLKNPYGAKKRLPAVVEKQQIIWMNL